MCSRKFIFTTAYIILLFIKLNAQTAEINVQQQDLKFDQIGIKQGLSQSTVKAIVQDSQGFIWFGTQDGLNRFDGYSIRIFKHDPADSNSIASNYITALLSDSEGNLWIGTMEEGVDCYSITKNQFYHHKHYDDNSFSLRDNRVTALFQDSEKNIWVGTQKGLDFYNHKTNKFIHIKLETKDAPASTYYSINAICEDYERHLWVGTTKGLFGINLQYGIDSVKYYDLDPTQNKLKIYNISSLFIDYSETLWIGTWRASLKSYNNKTGIFKNYKNSPQAIRAIYEDSSGNLWLGSAYTGLSIFNINTKKINQVSSLQNDLVNSLYEDKSGILWIGTIFRGVFVYNQHKNRFQHYLVDPHNPKVVMAIIEDHKDGLWAGTFGNGLIYFDLKHNRIKTFKNIPGDPNSISSNRIMALCETSDGSIWAGTIGGGLNRYNVSTHSFTHYVQHIPADRFGLIRNDVSALYKDQNGNLWIGNVAGGIDFFNVHKNIFKHYYPGRDSKSLLLGMTITTICEDKSGWIWVGTLGGLERFLPNPDMAGSFKKYLSMPKDLLQRGNTESVIGVLSLYLENKDTVWIGTTGNGLIEYHPVKNKWSYFTKEDGLPDNVIYGILRDDSGNLWLSTNNGITQFNIKTKRSKNYNFNDGLQSNEFNQGAYFKSSNGEFFFGGINGFDAFYPKDIKNNETIPPVYLTNFKVFDKTLPLPNPVPPGKIIKLSYSQNFFSFEFVALNYTSPEKNQYAYKLDGFDKNWHYVSAKQRYASYTNLDPGKYFLHIIGSNNDGIWNRNGYSVTLIITPPFWMTWWFRIIMTVVILFFIIWIIRYFVLKNIKEKTRKMEQETAIERERLRIARDMHDDLGAKVTQISILSELAKRDIEKEKSVETQIEEISTIGKKVVNALDEIVWSVNPKNDNLESLIDYVIQHVEQFLLHTKIKYRLDIPSDIPPVRVLFDIRHNIFMMVQEALTNVVKHSEATEVQIRVAVQESSFIISIKDNGNGFTTASPNTLTVVKLRNDENGNGKSSFSNGLENMKKRIEEIGGSFKINTSPGNGTNIIAEIPLNHK